MEALQLFCLKRELSTCHRRLGSLQCTCAFEARNKVQRVRAGGIRKRRPDALILSDSLPTQDIGLKRSDRGFDIISLLSFLE